MSASPRDRRLPGVVDHHHGDRRPPDLCADHVRPRLQRVIAGRPGGEFDIGAAAERIIARLDELGDGAAAERLRAALAGSTSGEILTGLGVELQALLRTPLRRDEEVGELLRETKRAVDDTLNPLPRWLRRLRFR